MASGGYGITKADMEASRLVFVMLQDAKPRRKVAIPILDGMSWTAFERQVKAKLKVRGGIQSMVLASTGEQVQSLSALQDIDEVYVIEAPEVETSTVPSHEFGTIARQPSRPDWKRTNGDAGPPGVGHSDEGQDKYAKRSRGSILSRLMPWLSHQPSLPVTTRDVEGGAARRRRRRMGRDTKNLLAVIIVVVVMFIMSILYMHSLHVSPDGPSVHKAEPALHAPTITVGTGGQ